MLDDTITPRLQAVFARELDLDPSEVTETLTYGSLPEWDSIGHMYVIHAVEDEFGFAFEDDEIGTMNSFVKLRDAIVSHSS